MPKISDITRETKEIVLPVSKVKVKLYKWLLAGEDKDILQNYLKGKKITVDGGLPSTELDLDAAYEVTEKALEYLFVDWDLENDDGTKAPLSQEVLRKLPAQDVAFLHAEVDKAISASRLPPAKKNSYSQL